MTSEALFYMQKRNHMGEELSRQFAEPYHAGDDECKGQRMNVEPNLLQFF